MPRSNLKRRNNQTSKREEKSHEMEDFDTIMKTGFRTAYWASTAASIYGLMMSLIAPQWALGSLLFGVSGITAALLPIGAAALAGFTLGAGYRFMLPIFKACRASLKSYMPNYFNFNQPLQEPKASTSNTPEPPPMTELSESREIIQWKPFRLNRYFNVQAYQQSTQSTSQASMLRRVYNGTTYVCKAFAANVLTQNGLIRTARYVPWARGLFEYTNACMPKGLMTYMYSLRTTMKELRSK